MHFTQNYDCGHNQFWLQALDMLSYDKMMVQKNFWSSVLLIPLYIPLEVCKFPKIAKLTYLAYQNTRCDHSFLMIFYQEDDYAS